VLAAGELKPYIVQVKTSDMLNAGTRSKVSIELHGELGRSENFELTCAPGTDGQAAKLFERGALDRFNTTLPNLGRLKRIRVELDGKGSGWHVNYVCVIDSNSGDLYTFSCDAWLDKKLDGGYLVRSFELTTQDTVSLEDIQFSSRPGTPASAAGVDDGARPPVSPDLRRQDYAETLEEVLPPPMTHFFPNRMPGAGGSPAPPKPPAPPSGQKFRPRRRNKLGAAAAAVRAGLAFGSAAVGPGGAVAPPPPAAGARPPRRPGIRAVPAGTSPGGDVPTPEPKGRMRPKRRATMLQAIASAAGVSKALADGAEEAQKLRPRALQDRSGSAGRAARQKLVQALVDGRPPDVDDVSAAVGASSGAGGGSGLPPGSYVPPAVDIVIRKIQRAWKEKVRKRKQLELRAAARIQACARGFLQRKHAQQSANSKAQARSADGLWWLTAHSKRPGVNSAALKSKWRVGEISQQIDSDFGKRLMKDMDLDKIPRRRKKRREAPTGLPRWFIYVTYAVAFIFCAACSYMIMLFGLAFEPAISRAWLLSSMFAIFLELFVTNPLSLVVSAFGEAQIEKSLAKIHDRYADDEDFDDQEGLG